MYPVGQQQHDRERAIVVTSALLRGERRFETLHPPIILRSNEASQGRELK
jgi:hypothetical protein